jgi:hypothetical protein
MFGSKGKELPNCWWNHESSDALVVQIGYWEGHHYFPAK